jgi:hypothetical protein
VRCRFVQPKIVRLPLADEQWIDVKRELSYGEQQQMFAATRRQFAPGQEPLLDATQIGRALMAAYIVSWSFVDAEGTPVPFSPAAISNLDVDAAKEIRDALDAHEEAVAQEKKRLATTSPSATSS